MEALLEWLERQAKDFRQDMDEYEANDSPIDYAYAYGASVAYEFVIKHLKENA